MAGRRARREHRAPAAPRAGRGGDQRRPPADPGSHGARRGVRCDRSGRRGGAPRRVALGWHRPTRRRPLLERWRATSGPNLAAELLARLPRLREPLRPRATGARLCSPPTRCARRAPSGSRSIAPKEEERTLLGGDGGDERVEARPCARSPRACSTRGCRDVGRRRRRALRSLQGVRFLGDSLGAYGRPNPRRPEARVGDPMGDGPGDLSRRRGGWCPRSRWGAWPRRRRRRRSRR